MSQIELRFGQNDFIKALVEKSDSPATFVHFEIPENLSFFRGHFPDNPIVPAFAIIEISLSLARCLDLAQSNTGHLKKIPNAKFLSIIKPKDSIRIQVQDQQLNSLALEWQQKNSKNEWQKCGVVELEF